MNRNKKRFYAVDLFAGCGGLSEGFIQAGFEIAAQIEMNGWACETLRTRHIYHHLKRLKKEETFNKYLRGEIPREEILKKFPVIAELIGATVIQSEFREDGFNEIINRINVAKKFYGIRKFHVVIGGPPCQPYSIIGRARDRNRMELDARHFLYKHYLDILENLQPDFFVFENVPGLITARVKGNGILQKMMDDFRNIFPHYEIAPGRTGQPSTPDEYIVDASEYGVPQRRKRIILIGYRVSLLKKNEDIRNIFHKLQDGRKSWNNVFTVADAISDLPHLEPGKGSDSWFGKYTDGPLTPYQEKMRERSPGVLNHCARTHMESDLDRYRFFIKYASDGNRNATLKDLMKERPDLTPEHRHLDIFLNRFKVQKWNRPASTVVAHICRDGHYYIHPDIKQCRSFTVREAARCQSFPDNFKFEGPRTEQFRQVGNAVPPLLAEVIARFILKELKKMYEG